MTLVTDGVTRQREGLLLAGVCLANVDAAFYNPIVRGYLLVCEAMADYLLDVFIVSIACL